MIYELLKDRIMNGGAGSEAIIQSLSISANGTYTAPADIDGYNPITVNVPQKEPNIQNLSITTNGTYTAPSGTDGYSPVVVDVQPNLEDITITANGTYSHTGKDGYDQVVVNVPQEGLDVSNITILDTPNGLFSNNKWNQLMPYFRKQYDYYFIGNDLTSLYAYNKNSKKISINSVIEINEFDDGKEVFIPSILTVRIDDIRYLLDNNSNASVGRQNKDLSGDIVIPESVVYNNKEYIVNKIVAPTDVTAWSSNTVSTEWLTKLENEHQIFPWMNYRIFNRKRQVRAQALPSFRFRTNILQASVHIAAHF